MPNKMTDLIELDIDDPMPVGKYIDIPIRHILADDPNYLRWFISESDEFEFEDKIELALENEALRLELVDDRNF